MKSTFMMDLAERVHLKRIGQEATEAVIDTLAFASAADGVLVEAEKKTLISAVKNLNWRREELDAHAYLESVVRRFMAMSSDQIEASIEKFCKSIGERVTDQWLQDELYYFVARIVAADDDVSDSEMRFMTTLGAVFGIFDQRKRAIDDRLVDDLD